MENRELEFRVFYQGKMYYKETENTWDLCKYDSWLSGLEYTNDALASNNFTITGAEFQEIYTQYIGHKDKNDKKIFEGDFIKSDWGWSGLVEFDSYYYNKLECTISDDIEIIGNIFENPELLKTV